MPRFQPEEILRTLERHSVRYVIIGGVGATLHGSPLPTRDFSCDEAFLRQMKLLNLMTRFGDLDLSFEPAGTRGYAQLSAGAVAYDLGNGLRVPVAALEDIIRSKETANREKDRRALPTLRLLLRKRSSEPPQPG